MITNRSMPPGSVIPELAYADVPEAARWLCNAFGFRERLRIGSHRIQLLVGDGSVVVVERETNCQSSSRVIVRVTDVDAHYMTAVGAEAQVISKPTTYPFGERQYSVLDLGGLRWTFSESVADSDPATWGGKLVAS